MQSVLLLVLFQAHFIYTGKICDTYEVSSSSPNTLPIVHKSLGLYKRNGKAVCDGRPVFKHVTGSGRYIFSSHDTWRIGVRVDGSTPCNFTSHLHHPLLKLNLPVRTGWMYSNVDMKDEYPAVVVACACDIIQVSSGNHVSQSEVLGTYRMDVSHKCHNRTTYKHVENNHYIQVDNYGKWIISDTQQDARGKKMFNCEQKGVAFNPAKPAPDIPNKSGWRFLEPASNRWRLDTTMKLTCSCTGYRLKTSLKATILGKNNLTGVYRVDDYRECHQRPIYKHTRHPYYMYVDTDDTWMVGGFEQMKDCLASGFAYSKEYPAPDNPSRSGWFYFNYMRGGWCPDKKISVTCE